MLFTEPAFLFVFLPVLLGAYFSCPERYRNHLLTGASFLFYAVSEWAFVPWLLGSVALNYFIALALARNSGTATAKWLLGVGIAADLGLLLVFKYAAFFVTNVNAALGAVSMAAFPVPSFALPLGISFFTFHKISYKIDVYRGQAEVRRDILDLLLYILLFPQLIAGPIIRYHDIATELRSRRHSRTDFAAGISRFIIGLAKKMLVANTVAVAADGVFSLEPGAVGPSLAWLGVVSYTLQIYFDFSGYSDMAIGLGRMFGFHILENFDHPYSATSITDFWRRWHISLSRWFRDYVYIPLGGNRKSTARTLLNLVTVFFLCGLWHGASWTFVLWGLYHGAFLVIERLGLSRILEALPRPFRHLYTVIIVMVGWILFRADTMAQARAFAAALFGAPASTESIPWQAWVDPAFVLAVVAGIIASTELFPVVVRWMRVSESASLLPRAPIAIWARGLGWASLWVLFLASVLQIAVGTYNPFIYFRF